jgi:hypothetical protein
MAAAAFAAIGLLLLNQSMAATGLYISGPTKVQKNTEFSVALKITTAAEIDAVEAVISYDTSKLQFVSFDDNGSAFPVLLLQKNEPGKVSITRGKLDGKVSGDLLVANVRFLAVASANKTALGLSGNATSAGSYTNPAASGITLSISNAKRK